MRLSTAFATHCGGSRVRVINAGRPLLAAAQQAHEIRDDLDLEQVLDIVHAIATMHGDAAHVQPILQITLDGLRFMDHTNS